MEDPKLDQRFDQLLRIQYFPLPAQLLLPWHVFLTSWPIRKTDSSLAIIWRISSLIAKPGLVFYFL
jgi:hypothetical protein